jgi:hypothetical protein
MSEKSDIKPLISLRGVRTIKPWVGISVLFYIVAEILTTCNLIINII